MNFLHDLLSDDHGHWDIGYIGMFVLILLILGVIPLMCGVMLLKFFIMPDHPFDVLTLGQAVALITGAFTGPLGALAAYIVAVKRPSAPLPAQITTETSVTQKKVETSDGKAIA